MYWMIAARVVVFGVALLGRVGVIRPPKRRPSRTPEPARPRVEPLQPGESYDTSVKLAMVPNIPLADMWCQRLREEGIAAFYKPSPYASGFGIYGGTPANPGLPVEVWVGEH